MKKQKQSKIIFFENDVFFRFYLRKLFINLKPNIIFKNKIPKNSSADVFVISSDFLDDFLKDELSYPHIVVLNRRTNKFSFISKFSSPKALYRGVLKLLN